MKKEVSIHLKTIGFTGFLLLLSKLLAYSKISELMLLERWWQILLFFLLQSLLINGWLQRKKYTHVIKSYLFVSIFRFITTILFVSILIFMHISDKTRFISSFLVAYILFLIFEVYIVLNVKPSRL